MSNPFQQADPWEVSLDQILPAGNHVVKIDEAETGKSRNQFFQIELKMSNSEGGIRDWMVVTPQSAGKVVALANAAKVDLPTDADIVDTATLELSQHYVDRFVGREVGIVVRDEQDYQDPTKTRQRVQGYVDPARVRAKQSDATAPSAAGSFRQVPNSKPDDVPIPF